MREATGRGASRAVAMLAALLAFAGSAVGQDFYMERDLDLQRRADGRPLQNVYWISLPLIPDVDDVANTGSVLGNKCVGTGGPLEGDGVINVDDLICSWWTARQSPATAGVFAITVLDPGTCTPIFRVGSVGVGGVRFSGTVFDLRRDAGYQVNVAVQNGASHTPRNRAVLKGSHDPNWTGRPIFAAPTCPTGTPNCCGANAPRRDLIAFPYDSVITSADEILCGLEDVDWSDANGDGKPDTCWEDGDGDGAHDLGEAATGVFDGRHAMSVSTWINDEATNGPITRTVTTTLGTVWWSGSDFPLAASEAYMLQMSTLHEPTLWFPARP